MHRWIIKKRIEAFETAYDYDASYLRDVLDAGAVPLLRLARLRGFGEYRKGVPEPAWYTARIAAALHEDCGPCAQLVVTMAEQAGVDAAVIRAVVTGDDEALPGDARLAVGFTRATLARSSEADELRDEVVPRFGQAGLVSLAFAITAARLYPTIKYALGHGRACQKVRVGDAIVPRPSQAT